MSALVLPTPFVECAGIAISLRTLNSSLRTSGREQAHRPDHEVLEDSIRDLASASSVGFEARDLVCVIRFCVAERALEA